MGRRSLAKGSLGLGRTHSSAGRVRWSRGRRRPTVRYDHYVWVRGLTEVNTTDHTRLDTIGDDNRREHRYGHSYPDTRVGDADQDRHCHTRTGH